MRFDQCNLLLQLLLIQAFPQVNSSNDVEYYNLVLDYDSLVYFSVAVPKHSNAIEIEIWSIELESLYLLWGFERYPTLSNFDRIDRMNDFSHSNIFKISINDPPATVFYFGIWGGKLLHSYRYFSGSPSYINVNVFSSISYCSTRYCETNIQYPKIDYDTPYSYYVLPIVHNTRIEINIPDGLERCIILANISVSQDLYCSNLHANLTIVTLTTILYSVSMHRDSSTIKSSTTFNYSHKLSNFKSFPIEFTIEKPISGLWILEFQPILKENINTGITMETSFKNIKTSIIARAPSTFKYAGNIIPDKSMSAVESIGLPTRVTPVKCHGAPLQLALRVLSVECPDGFTGYDLQTSTSSKKAGATHSSIDHFVNYSLPAGGRVWDQDQFPLGCYPSSWKYANDSCAVPVEDMLRARCMSDDIVGQFVSKSVTICLPAPPAPLAVSSVLPTPPYAAADSVAASYSRYVVFLSRIDSIAAAAMLGGAMTLQLTVHMNKNRSPLKVAEGFHKLTHSSLPIFVISARAGSLPYAPGNLTSNSKRAAESQMSFTSASAEVEVVDDFSLSDSVSYDLCDGNVLYTRDDTMSFDTSVKYSWTVQRPSLDGLASVARSISKDSLRLYLRLDALATSQFYSDALIESYFRVSVALVPLACPATLCVHGKCILQRYDDIRVASCVCRYSTVQRNDSHLAPLDSALLLLVVYRCRYPWAGENCSELSEPIWLYRLQVCLLIAVLVHVI